MSGAFADGLVLPAMALALLGWLVPRALSLLWAEGVRPLIGLALAATLIMLAAGTGFFLALYVWRGVPLAAVFEGGWASGLVHFGRLGAASALLWGPIMLLSVAGLPRTWTRATW